MVTSSQCNIYRVPLSPLVTNNSVKNLEEEEETQKIMLSPNMELIL